MSTSTSPARQFLSILLGRRRKHARNPRACHLPAAENCLEERLLLSGVMSLARHSDVQGVAEVRYHPSAKDSGHTRALTYRNITYTAVGGHAQQLNVYMPAGTPPPGGWPVIMAIHGGGWRSQTNLDYGNRVASAFVPNGYAVIAPNYVLSAPGKSTWPLNLEDVQNAVRWTRINAAMFKLNPSQIVAMGESAGANLANLLGTYSPWDASGPGVSAAVQAVISFSSPTDLTTLYQDSSQARKAVAQFLGGPPPVLPASYAAASPVDLVGPNDPPVFLVHGASDPLVPVTQSAELAAALTNAGVPHQLVVIAGGHNLDFPVRTPRNLLSQILEFLSTTWKDRGSQSLNL